MRFYLFTRISIANVGILLFLIFYLFVLLYFLFDGNYEISYLLYFIDYYYLGYLLLFIDYYIIHIVLVHFHLNIFY